MMLPTVSRTTLAAPFLALALVAPIRQAPAASPPGLVVQATDGDRTVVFLTPTPNFTLAPGDSLHPQLKPAFQSTWTGVLHILRADKYTLHADARVFVDGAEIQGKPTQLEAGERVLKLEFKRNPGPARVRLEWESGHFRREPVPASALGHVVEPPELGATRALERGRQLAEDLNCTACHKTTGARLHGRPGPDLSAVGDRATPAWLFAWLDNPQHFRKDAAMPAVLGNTTERADVAAYLATLKAKSPVTPLKEDAARAAKGRELLGSLGCAACHDGQRNPLAGIGSKYSAAALAQYLINPLAVDPSGRMPDLALSHGEAETLALHLVESKNADYEKAPPAGDAIRGRELMSSAGCVSCHTVKDERGALVANLTAPAFDKLGAGRGCLADSPAGKAARYGLSADDRASLTAFVAQPDRTSAPAQDFHRMAAQFNCNACHELYGPAKLNFAANQSPPPLTDAGNKLRESWLSAVLLHQKRVRPWMDVRMPHFGDATKPMVTQFASRAGAEFGEGATVATPSKDEAEAAVKILGSGEGGLACINCHDYRGQKSQGEMRGPDIIEMNARIRVDWLKRWLWEPQRIAPGTAMPAFFSGMAAAKADEIIAQIATALTSGRDMPTPPGWGEAGMIYTITVGDAPVLLRTFLPNSPARAIAVGLPGGQAFCFDAQFGFLRFAWSGGFLDMKPAWADRGGQMAMPLGTIWFNSPSSFPLRLGGPEAQPKITFRGYKLEQKVPVFLYDLDGVAVREKITATSDGKGLNREFELGPVKAEVWFVAPDGGRVAFTSSQGQFTNGRLKLPPGDKVKFTVTMKPQ